MLMSSNVHHYQPHLKKYAQENRRNPTPEEERLWYEFLRRYPFQFRRQKALGCYIVDFICSAARLIVEIDGSQHFTPEGREWDVNRTAFLNAQGYEVIRFTNRDVSERFEAVCQSIAAAVEQGVYGKK